MSKNTFFSGQPIFSQILSFVPAAKIHRLASKHNSDRYYKSFFTYDHLVTMLYTIFNKCNGLREVTTGMMALEQKIGHLGIDTQPCKSTFSDANTNRNPAVFEAIYMDLFSRYQQFLPDSRSKKSSRLYIADSTTISLFQEILGNAGRSPVNGKRKGGIKVHTLTRSDEDVPCLIRFTAASAADSPFLKEIKLAPHSIIVFDRGYNNYTQWNRLNKDKVTWVTRLTKSTVYKIIESKTLSEKQQKHGVLKDCIVEVGHNHSKTNVKVKARLIEYYDKVTKETFQFLTNGFRFAPFTICEFYRKRWQIESLFKRLKQNYPLRHFVGDTPNAIQIQIWCALIADLILKVIQSSVKRKWSFSNLSSFVRIHLMTYIELFSFLQNPEKTLIKSASSQQAPSLFIT
jgi:hypothetical protein